MGSDRRRIAIIGSGISGLTACWALSKQNDVEIFDCAATLGMDQHSHDLPNGQRLDTPPRSINAAYYPNLLQLYHAAGIQLAPFSWDFSAGAVGQPRTTMCALAAADSTLPFRGSSWGSLVRVSRDGLRMAANLPRDLSDTAVHSMDFGSYLQSRGPWCDEYVQNVLLPALATWLTASYEGVMRYPAVLILEFLIRHTMGANYHTAHGSQDAVARLAAHASRVRTSTHVVSVQYGDGTTGSKPRVTYVPPGGQQCMEEYDAVVVATQANQAASLLRGTPAHVDSALRSWVHERSEVVIHTDPAIMPRCRRDWMPANFASDFAAGQGSCTLWFSVPGPAPSSTTTSSTATSSTTPSGTAPSGTAPAAMIGHAGKQGGRANAAAEQGAKPGNGDDASSSPPSSSASVVAVMEGEGEASTGKAGHVAAGQTRTQKLTLTQVAVKPAAGPAGQQGLGSSGPATPTGCCGTAGAGRRGKGGKWHMFQTWNPLAPVDAAAVLARYSFDRPMVTLATGGHVEQVWQAQGTGGVFIIGAYTMLMVPLQESAAVSALRVAAAMGCPAPWLPGSLVSQPLAVDVTSAAVAARALQPTHRHVTALLPVPPARATTGAMIKAAVCRLPGLLIKGSDGLQVNGMAKATGGSSSSSKGSVARHEIGNTPKTDKAEE